MLAREGRAPWLRALIVATALALAAAGCGGSDDDGEGGDAGGATPAQAADRPPLPPDAAEPRTPVESEIHDAYSRFTGAMTAQDHEAACAVLTPRAQKRIGEGIGCERRFKSLLGSGETGQDPAYITRLNVEGDRAIAGAKTRTSDVYTVEFRKHDGEWKINGDEK